MNILKKILIGLIGITLLSASGFWQQPATAKPDIDNFYFKNFEVDYYLSKDKDNKSVLKVKEKLVPVFPDHDQNRGIVRSIPAKYKGYSHNFQLESVHRDGKPANIHKQEVKNNFHVLTIRDASDDSYMHGEHTYEINYQLADVIGKPKDANLLEFYWDVSGTGWNQRFNQVIARLHLSKEVSADLITDKLACYTGKHSSQEKNCKISFDRQLNTITVATTSHLAEKENMTMAVGFREGSFDYPKISEQTEKIVAISIATTFGLGILLMLLGFSKKSHVKKSKNLSKMSYPAEFLPPKNSDIFTDAFILDSEFNITPKIINLAVNHKIQIIEGESTKKPFATKGQKSYKINILNVKNLTKREHDFLAILLESPNLKNATYDLKPEHSVAKFTAMKELNRNILEELKGPGSVYDAEDIINKEKTSNRFILAIALFIISFFIGLSWKDELEWTHVFMAASVIIGVFALIIEVLLVGKTLTPKGEQIKLHLLGLKKFIKLSEQERLAFAQSLKGAQRSHLRQSGESRVVLYEKILPYAILFGLEKSWNQVLEAEYKDVNNIPSWYVGAGAFSAANFSNSMNSFTSSVHSSYSSSSGSGGGGFSGGGGGGGGGGGA